MHRKRLLVLVCLLAAAGILPWPAPLRAQMPLPPVTPAAPGGATAAADVATSANPETGEKLYSLKFQNAPLTQVLQFYSDLTGRTLLEAPGVNANITLRSHSKLTLDESLQALRTVLAMNNVGLVHVGEKFVKIVPVAQVQQEGLTIGQPPAAGETKPDTDEVVSEIINLKYIDFAEAQKAVSGLMHGYGKMLALERINSILIVDAVANLNRIREIITQIDQPLELKEKLHILPVRHSKASDIKARLEEIIAESKEKEKQPTVRRPSSSGPPGVETATPAAAAIPGVIRARPPTPTTPTTPTEEPEEGRLIRGSVRIVADDRTSLLIIITRPENMKLFEELVTALDVPTDPDVVVKVIRLEYADVKNVSGMLNDLIGAAKKEAPKPAAAGKPGEGATEESSRAALLQEFIQQQRAASQPREAGKTKVGELSAENIKILSDERSNALIIMASKNDLAALEEIVQDMDIMLSQVLVEAVILSVNLDKGMQSGVDWVQRSMVAYNNKPVGKDPIFAFGGGGGGGKADPLGPASLLASAFNPGQGLTYYFTHYGLNLDVVLQWASTDSRTKILSSPVIMTTDNKEAKLDVSTEQYIYKGQTPTTVGGTVAYVPNVETRRVGINLTVTPRINAKKLVVMEIKQKIENVAGTQVIQEDEWPIVASRELSASIAVQSGETIVLGGLVQDTRDLTRGKIPLLGDIPLLGWLFGSRNDTKKRNEIIVFITPRVLDTPEEITAEGARRKDNTATDGMWKRGWSTSKIAEPTRADARAEREAKKVAERAAAEKVVTPDEAAPATTNSPVAPAP